MALSLLSRASVRLRSEAGVTLVELLVVLAILAVVLAPLAQSFSSAMRSEVSQIRREEAHSNARLALQRMRLDIHCAGGVTSVDENTVGGFTLTLTEAYEGQEGWCPGVIPAGVVTTGLQWCTVPHASTDPLNPTRFVLYRFLGLDTSTCGSTATSTFQVDYVSQPTAGWPTSSRTTTPPVDWIGNLWPDSPACPSGGLPTLAVDLHAVVDPVSQPNERYRLTDRIALRNALRCA